MQTIIAPRRRCIRLQNFNSSGPLVNLRNGAVPEADRSPAPAWWWQPAIEVVAQHEEMGGAYVLSAAASGWFDLRCRRRGADGNARLSDILAVAGRISALASIKLWSWSGPSLSEAIRRLVEIGLAAKPPAKTGSKPGRLLRPRTGGEGDRQDQRSIGPT
jgi:hypothetical protein